MSGDERPPEASGAPPRLRGLWSVMHTDVPTTPPEPVAEDEEPPASAVAEPVPSNETDRESETPVDTEETARPAPRGLWALMSHAAAPVAEDSDPEIASPDEDQEASATAIEPWTDAAEELTADTTNDLEDQEDATPAETVSGLDIRAGREDASGVGRDPGQELGWRATQACLIGLVAVPLSALAVMSHFWAGTPAALAGFAALLVAASVMLSNTRPSPSALLRAGCGAALGVVALLLGPFVFTPWGNSLREAQTERSTIKHLRAIGVALQSYQQENGAYPVGGTHIDSPDGPRRGGHGWMTRLLPALNEGALYNRIDLQLPFDDPANLGPLGTPVEAFFAAGGDRQKLPSGLAVAHFAGVGGSLRPGRGETLAAGIFDLDRAVTAADVLDGLSQTLVAGELPGGYPPWGDPENFRVPGQGINKDSRGFGNASQTGAILLFGDGRAKFFANKTDPQLLQRLATRDAGDLAGSDLP